MEKIQLVVLLSILLSSSLSYASEVKIAVVHSYHKEFGWVDEVNRGITAFATGRKIFGITPKEKVQTNQFTYFYMDAKSHQGDAKYFQKIGGEISKKLDDLKPDVTIICDDEALEYVAAPKKTQHNHRFVFLGVNNDPRTYGVVKDLKSPEFNITGLLSEHPFRYSLKLAKEILEDIDKIVVFFDNSVTSEGIMANFKSHMENIDDPDLKKKIQEYVVSSKWSEWQKAIKKYQNGKDSKKTNLFVIGTYYAIKDSAGKRMTNQEVANWITRNSNVPEVAVLTSDVSQGFLLSISNPGFVHGYRAMNIAEDIRKGKRIATIPIDVPLQKAIHANTGRAKELGIEIPTKVLVLSKFFKEKGY